MKRILPTLALCTMLLALPLLTPFSPAHAAATGWPDTGHAEEMYRARNFESVSQSPYGVRMFRTPMYDTVELILGAVPGITVTADIMEKDPKYAQELNQKSAVASISNYIAMMYTNPPADLALWIQDTGQTLGFLPRQAHAQGVGFSGLAPLLPIWKAFRNIAYLLLAVVMIVIGFMVMLRKKIDPKTVVTVQNALPRIVIALLLVTFSYAIVAIMIDAMYLLILLAVSLFKSSDLLPTSITNPETLYTTGSLWANVFSVDFSPWKLLFGINNISPALLNAGAVVGGIILAVVGALGLGAVTGGPAAPIGAVPGVVLAVGMPLLGLLISLAALFLFLRLFVFFLGAYIKIIVSLIFGPVQILFEAVPGTNAFSSWFRNLVSNILVFPTGAIMFMLSAVFIRFSNEAGTIWHPPYASLIVNNVASLGSWIAIGILFAIPSVVNSIQDMLKAKPVMSAGPEGLAGAVSQPTMLAWQIGQFVATHRQMDKIAGAVKAGQGGGSGHPSSGGT